MKKFAALLIALWLPWAGAPALAEGLSGGGGGTLSGGSTPVGGTCPSGNFLYNNSGVLGCSSSSATVALPQAVTGGTSGGVPYFSATTTMSSSALLTANALMVGGGAGAAPSTISTGTGVLSALGQNVNGSGAISLTTSPALTTPSLSGATVSTSATVSAGTNAQGQAALTSDYNVITTAANNPSGATLPTGTIGRSVMVVNKGANPVNLYPASGGAIDALGANAAISLPVNGVLFLQASSATQWYSSANEATAVSALTGLGTNVGGALAIATETTGAFARQNGSITAGNCLKWSATGIQDAGAACGGGGGSPGGVTNSVQVNSGSSTFVAPTSSLILGAADAASPTALTVSVQNVLTGTSNGNGANLTIRSSAGTGSGNGGSIIFQTAAPGGSGTAQNAFATAMSIDHYGSLTVAGNITASLTNASIIIGGAGSSITSPLSGQGLKLGARGDAAAPIAQSLSTNSVVAGTTNTAGSSFKIIDSAGTGSAISGGIEFDDHPAGTSGTSQNAAACSFQVSVVAAGMVTLCHPWTTGTIPACSGSTQYSLASVSDGNAPSYNGAYSGGGTTKALVFCDGTSWKYH
jgi:hypothetical protein